MSLTHSLIHSLNLIHSLTDSFIHSFIPSFIHSFQTPSFSVCVGASELFVGCANGISRVFDVESLNLLTSLPRCHPLGVEVKAGQMVSIEHVCIERKIEVFSIEKPGFSPSIRTLSLSLKCMWRLGFYHFEYRSWMKKLCVRVCVCVREC